MHVYRANGFKVIPGKGVASDCVTGRHQGMAPAGHSLISNPSSTAAAFSSFPPKPPNSKPKHSPTHQNQNQRLQIRADVSRRDIASLSFLVLAPYSLSQCAPPATAISIGISGPKDWLKEQKKKSSKFLLAPIDASRESLRAAYLLLTRDSDYTNKDIEEVQRLLRSAARDCDPAERNSFVSFQANTGVEVCTFRLVVKNAASLLADKDPVKLEAEAILNDLIRYVTLVKIAELWLLDELLLNSFNIFYKISTQKTKKKKEEEDSSCCCYTPLIKHV
ncbi:uncharacterized protein LOC107420221 isoform X2 [Ziziphus jujuba]|uniref:Uncharacterized protein LOC107420221 isoform X2 n=1 Tax=Ziziphus jujuba TaxID=326968 RepID=A0ABM3IP67_ZIZJJ|nr:uncharacterized protein LOC107420221 isoform X2 [Ziziphus jujuba]